MEIKMERFGWNKFFQEDLDKLELNDKSRVGRVSVEYKGLYKIFTEEKEIYAELKGSLIYNKDYASVGDWVVYEKIDEDRAIITNILESKTKISRKVAGGQIKEQVVATNVDIIFIVMSLNQDYNLRRIERYLTLVWNSGAIPVIILSKSDLCEDIFSKKIEVENIAFGVPVIDVNIEDEKSILEIKEYIAKGKTAVFIGSSGVGKSTLINLILKKDIQKVKELRLGDDKGKHTTTNRQMFLLEEGGLLLDTPGIREIQFWDDNDGLGSAFSDIEELAKSCKFKNCTHTNEPRCNVKNAVENGILDNKRLKNYFKMKAENEYIEQKKEMSHDRIEKEKWKGVTKFARELNKKK